MEPIRSHSQRGLDRRKRSHTTREDSDIPGGFAAVFGDDDSITPAGEGDGGAVEATLGVPPISAPIERLYDAVHEAGQRLLHQRTYTAAQQYRETVRQFLRKVIPDANAVTVTESHQDILSRKRYYLLTEINSAVDRLVSGLLHTQTEQLDILKRLEEIEGLLVDLMQ